ncbi:hypothetical protein [Polynucleobacter sphagniphilus]|uniref:hypothetical protein n=1 Tax=Polynucleobacter sphagniphilus TaxID=1743169 RepID=UPI002405F922|nr:hypothetical protein [Polynucleobacter sphagniphilus]MDF9787151.1 hypothetical protein [Polynucleobacter sphagniphilus]
MQNLDISIPLRDMSPLELESFRKCSFLVNLLSEMYEQYQIWIKEHPFDHRGFTWENKINSCLITSNFPIDEWSFGDLIWSKFKLTDNAGKVLLEGNEPFGCIATDMSGNAYLVFRGSKSLKDFSSDAQMANIQYEVPSQKRGSEIFLLKKDSIRFMRGCEMICMFNSQSYCLQQNY